MKSQIATSNIAENIHTRGEKKKRGVQAIILTSKNCNITKLDINKFNEQYGILKIARTDKFHDRFIIIDNKNLYHCGVSFKDLGKYLYSLKLL